MVALMSRPAFGDRLRNLRQERGLTLAVLAEQAGIHLQSLAKLEAGRSTNPGWDTVCSLAEALGVSTEEFRLATADEPLSDEDPGPPPRFTGKRK